MPKDQNLSGKPREQSAHNETLSFPYKATSPTDSPGIQFREEDKSRIKMAHAIPKDGRMDLLSDLSFVLRIAGIQILGQRMDITWKSMCDDRSRRELQISSRGWQLLTKGAKASPVGEPLISYLGFFSCHAFHRLGLFVVRDIDPNSGFQFLYDMGATKPRFMNSELPLGENVSRSTWYEFPSMSDVFDWQDSEDSQTMFCQAGRQMSSTAPWQRIILWQGLSFGSDIRLVRSRAATKIEASTFSYQNEMAKSIQPAVELHLSGQRRGGSELTNPYSDMQNAFHITFFERLEDDIKFTEETSQELGLKIGRLYERPQEAGHSAGSEDSDTLAFRRSSFTVFTTTGKLETDLDPEYPRSENWHWTMLILSPSGFFPGVEYDWAIDTGRVSRKTAELSCIVYALEKVEHRWRRLDKYIASLLVEDFMDSTAYSKLLFDDASFSRSRLYFWVLGCLSEFDPVIDDNIRQCKLYRIARIEPLRDYIEDIELRLKSPVATTLSYGQQDLKRLVELDKKASAIGQSLEDLRSEFSAKQARVQILRDGLFNASALMESRSSTRLGQNVQLLTYVSIFYLPLAFCAALWAIPNITDQKTKIPFIVTATLVGLVTYVVVANLGNIIEFLARAFRSWKNKLLDRMEGDEQQHWRFVRKQFEEFPPQDGNKVPSDWWLLRYQMRDFWRKPKPESTDSEDETVDV